MFNRIENFEERKKNSVISIDRFVSTVRGQGINTLLGVVKFLVDDLNNISVFWKHSIRVPYPEVTYVSYGKTLISSIFRKGDLAQRSNVRQSLKRVTKVRL
jgi:hypothetical protein